MDGKPKNEPDSVAQCRLWSLRPAGEHTNLRRAAQAAGFPLRALPLQRLVALPADAALGRALAAPLRIYSSPAAVRFALKSGARLGGAGQDFAVGSGTAAALRQAGACVVRSPTRMDSEGLLALPELQDVDGMDIGIITAPRGRGLLSRALRERGARLQLAEVYQRLPLHGSARRLAACADDAGGVLLLSSAEVLALLVRRLPAVSSAGKALRCRPAVASSARLVTLAREAGFTRVVQASGPTATALIEAAATLALYTVRAAAGRQLE